MEALNNRDWKRSAEETAGTSADRKQEIIEKIRACFARAGCKGASQAEAETSIVMAKRLMANYNLSQAEIEIGGEDSENPDTSNIVEEGGLDHYKILEQYEITLTHVCEHLFNVQPLIKNGWNKLTGKTGKYMVFIGKELDVALAKEVYSILRADVNALAKTLGVEVSKSDKYQYRLGVVYTLCERAKEMAKGLSKEEESKCTALVLVKNAAVQKFMDQTYPNLKTRNSRINMSGAFLEGRKDGKKVSMNFNRKLR